MLRQSSKYEELLRAIRQYASYSAAPKQGVPEVLGQDAKGNQPYLDGAWYYAVGAMGFVQQLLATRKVAILVFPIPPLPRPDAASLLPDAYTSNLAGVTADVVTTAIN